MLRGLSNSFCRLRSGVHTLLIGTLVVFGVDAVAGEKKALSSETAPFFAQFEEIEDSLRQAERSVSPFSENSIDPRVGEITPRIESSPGPSFPTFGDLGNAKTVMKALGTQFGRRDDFTVPGSKPPSEPELEAPPSDDDPVEKKRFLEALRELFVRLSEKSEEEFSIDDYYKLRDKARRSETWLSEFFNANAGTKALASDVLAKFAERDADRDAKDILVRLIEGDGSDESKRKASKGEASKSPRVTAPQTH